jgi:hypothetical protein
MRQAAEPFREAGHPIPGGLRRRACGVPLLDPGQGDAKENADDHEDAADDGCAHDPQSCRAIEAFRAAPVILDRTDLERALLPDDEGRPEAQVLPAHR